MPPLRTRPLYRGRSPILFSDSGIDTERVLRCFHKSVAYLVRSLRRTFLVTATSRSSATRAMQAQKRRRCDRCDSRARTYGQVTQHGQGHGRDACLANQEAFRLERQASGNRLAAIVRRGMQLNPKRLHQPQPPEADSAAAQRAQDPEDDKGLRVTLVPRRAAPGAADNKGPRATLDLPAELQSKRKARPPSADSSKPPCRSLKECKKKRKRSRRTSPSVEKAAASANATGRTSSSSKTVAASANTEGRGRSQPRSLQKRHRSCTPGPFHRRSRANKETAEKVESEDAPRSKTASMREPNFCDSDTSVPEKAASGRGSETPSTPESRRDRSQSPPVLEEGTGLSAWPWCLLFDSSNVAS